jgi:hypothetical protein
MRDGVMFYLKKKGNLQKRSQVVWCVSQSDGSNRVKDSEAEVRPCHQIESQSTVEPR